MYTSIDEFFLINIFGNYTNSNYKIYSSKSQKCTICAITYNASGFQKALEKISAVGYGEKNVYMNEIIQNVEGSHFRTI